MASPPSLLHPALPAPGGPDEPQKPHRLPGRAALKPADRADAKRRRPGVELSRYAQSRGLTYLASQGDHAFFAAMPLDDRLQFNVLRGPSAAGGPARDGLLFHHLVAWPVDHDGDLPGGPFYSVVHLPKLDLPKGWWKPNRTWIPVVGGLLDHPNDDRPRYTPAVGVPCTVAAALVPEAAGLSRLMLDNGSGGALGGRRESLKKRGLPGWDLRWWKTRPDAAIEALLAGPVRALIETNQRRPLFRVDVWHATVTITVDGFVTNEHELDALRRAATQVADVVAASCGPAVA